MSLLKLPRENKGASTLCLIMITVGTVVSVLRAEQFDIIPPNPGLTQITAEQCKERVLAHMMKPQSLDELIAAYMRSAGRGLSILNGTAKFGLAAEYEAMCEMFGNTGIRCVEVIFCADLTRNPVDSDGTPTCDCVGELSRCIANSRSEADRAGCTDDRLSCRSWIPCDSGQELLAAP